MKFRFPLFIPVCVLLTVTCGEEKKDYKKSVTAKQKVVPVVHYPTHDSFLKAAAFKDSLKYQSGDSVLFESGDLFGTKNKYAIIGYCRGYHTATYHLYKYHNKEWRLILIDTSGISGEGVIYRIDDYNFDGVKDLALCNLMNINGNMWFNLHVNHDTVFTFIPSFTSIAHPVIRGKQIYGRYIGGVYDEHSRTLYNFENGKYIRVEDVTMVVEQNKDGEILHNKICYYKRAGGKLRLQFCKTNADSLFSTLMFEEE